MCVPYSGSPKTAPLLHYITQKQWLLPISKRKTLRAWNWFGKGCSIPDSNLHLYGKLPFPISGWFTEPKRMEGYCPPGQPWCNRSPRPTLREPAERYVSSTCCWYWFLQYTLRSVYVRGGMIPSLWGQEL